MNRWWWWTDDDGEQIIVMNGWWWNNEWIMKLWTNEIKIMTWWGMQHIPETITDTTKTIDECIKMHQRPFSMPQHQTSEQITIQKHTIKPWWSTLNAWIKCTSPAKKNTTLENITEATDERMKKRWKAGIDHERWTNNSNRNDDEKNNRTETHKRTIQR